MKKPILNISQFMIILCVLFCSYSFSQEAINQEASQIVSYDFELKGITLEQTIKIFGEPSVQLKVNSASSKRNMPPFLVEYFNSWEKLVEALICRWDEPSKYIEICYEKIGNEWHVLGRTTKIKKKP